jgi:hypothetical protein
MNYQEFIEKQLESYQKKYDDAEECHGSTGEKRYYTAMKKHEMFIQVFETALNEQTSKDSGTAEYRRKCKNLYQTCKNIAQRDEPTKAVQMILGILSQEAE